MSNTYRANINFHLCGSDGKVAMTVKEGETVEAVLMANDLVPYFRVGEQYIKASRSLFYGENRVFELVDYSPEVVGWDKFIGLQREILDTHDETFRELADQ